MPLLEQLLLAVLPLVVATAGTAIYLNRRKSDKLYQRLFGLEDDPTDDGAMHDITNQLDGIDSNVRELNHERIDNIEERLDKLGESIGMIRERLDDRE